MRLRTSLPIYLLLFVLMVATPNLSHGLSDSTNWPHQAPLPHVLAEYTREWYCTTTDGWNQQSNSSEFTTMDTIGNNGTLLSAGEYFYMSGVPDPGSGTAGPLYTTELETAIPVANLSLFEVDFELVYQFNEFGYLSVYLFDQMKTRIGMLRIHDEWQGTESRVECAYYGTGELIDGVTLDSDFLFSWRVTARIWREPSNGSIMADINDGTPEGIQLLNSTQVGDTRVIQYIGIHAARESGTNYEGNSLRLHNIAISSIDYAPLIQQNPPDSSDDPNNNSSLNVWGEGVPAELAGILIGFAAVGFAVFAWPRRKDHDDAIQTHPVEEDSDSIPIVPLGEKPENESKLGKGVHALRGCHVVGQEFQYKVKVLNNTESVITNVVVSILAYPEDCLSLKGENSKVLKRIEPGGFRSPQFEFAPTKDCVEGTIQATVSYIDHRNEVHTSSTKPFVVRSICDLLAPLEMTSGVFDRLMLQSVGTRNRETIPLNPKELFSKANQILPLKNFFIVSSESSVVEGKFIGMIRSAAEGKYTGNRIEIQLRISGEVTGHETLVSVEVSGDDDAMLPSTLREISEGLNSWICMHCGAPMNPAEVVNLRTGHVVQCHYCSRTMTMEI